MLLFRPPLLNFGRAGVRAADIAVGGDEDSPLYNDFTYPDDNEVIALWALLTPLLDATSNGATTVDDQGGYAHVGPDDGSWEQDYRLLWMPPTGATGAADGTITIVVGASGSYNVDLTESSSAADAVAAAAAFVVALTEAASASDSAAAALTALAAMAESLSAADAFTVTAVYGAAAAEAASASDVTNWGGAFYAVEVAETATLADAVSAALQLLAAMAEAGSAADTPTVVLSAGASVAEVASAVDAVTGTNPTAYSVAITEAGSALETIVVSLAPSGVVIISAPPAGRRLQTSQRINIQAGRRPSYRGGTR